MKTGKILISLLIVAASIFFLYNPDKNSNHPVSDALTVSDTIYSGIFKSEHAETVLNKAINRPFAQKFILSNYDTSNALGFLTTTALTEADPRLEPLKNLAEEDEIMIGSSHSGCFHFFSEIMFIKRNKDTYTIRLLSDRFKSSSGNNVKVNLQKDLSFIHEIKRFQEDCLTLLTTSNSNICTSSSTYYVCSGNKLLTFYDASCQWGGYNDFLNSFSLLLAPSFNNLSSR